MVVRLAGALMVAVQKVAILVVGQVVPRVVAQVVVQVVGRVVHGG